MPYPSLANYLTRRREIPYPEAYQALLEQLFEAYERGNTLIEASIAEPCLHAWQAAGLLGHDAPVIAQLNDKLGRFWLNVNHQQERELSTWIRSKALWAEDKPSSLPPPPNGLNVLQQRAWQHAQCHRLTLINGGPGTGKTHTLAHIVKSLLQKNPPPSIALAAPTGKAAKRMSQSLQELPLEPAQTLHRLLGISANPTPRYHAQNPLPYDVVMVDEASMLSLQLAHALFAALAPQSALILLGDAQQLAAVDAGAVLADMAQSPDLSNHVITLEESRRFHQHSIIGQLARFSHQPEALLECIKKPHPDLHYQSHAPTLEQLAAPYRPYLSALQEGKSFESLMALFDGYRILSTTHHGKLGIREINQKIAQWHKALCHQPPHAEPFHGQPIIITQNDYRLGLFNGDIGLCLQHEGRLRLFLEEREPIAMQHLNPTQYQSAYALTVHKSQGSEFEHVALVLPDDEHQSRELLYTGITRAKTKLSLYASQSALLQASQTPTLRQTGLLRYH
ncbi:MAG: exodeoxyribonuclease V subunit alpha [Cardiobacteriaceae bacterium]|nr:exodeoxyribonuclease V subunit alpha [Cardiobacteriaceae bacterium]